MLRHAFAPALAILIATAPATAHAQGIVIECFAADDTIHVRPDGIRADGLQLPTHASHHWQTGVFRPDRLQHASLSLSLGVGAGLVSHRPGAGAGAALALGLLKELSDDHFDRGDLVADAVGAALAALVVASLTRR